MPVPKHVHHLNAVNAQYLIKTGIHFLYIICVSVYILQKEANTLEEWQYYLEKVGVA